MKKLVTGLLCMLFISSVFAIPVDANITKNSSIEFSSSIAYAATEGWIQSGSNWYYYVKGKKVTGWKQIGGKWYYFDSSGIMLKGWQKVSGKWYYLHPTNGDMKTGWQKINNIWYYLIPSSGAMVTGWYGIDSKWYYFNSSGAMQTGWLNLSNKWYYCNSSGVMLTGAQKIGGLWYYFNSSGAMQTGYLRYDGFWYWHNSPNGDYVVGSAYASGTSMPSGYASSCSSSSEAASNNTYKTMSNSEFMTLWNSLSEAKSEFNTAKTALKISGRTNASNAIAYFLDGGGSKRTININSHVTGWDAGISSYSRKYAYALQLAKTKYDTGHSHTRFKSKAAYHNSIGTITDDWYIALGGFYSYFEITTTGNRMASFTYCISDHYDFPNNSDRIVGFGIDTTNRQARNLHLAGLARNYTNYGKYTVSRGV